MYGDCAWWTEALYMMMKGRQYASLAESLLVECGCAHVRATVHYSPEVVLSSSRLK